MNIKELRPYMKRHKITYRKLSEQSGVSISTIKYIFSGYTTNPQKKTKEAIYKALGLNDDTESYQD